MPTNVSRVIEEQFSKLPLPVQRSITSGHVKDRFQELAKTHKLHLDQWQVIEDLILLTILGIYPPEELAQKIVAESGLDNDSANKLVEDVAVMVFRPIREELERELGAPQAREEAVSDMEKLRREALAEEVSGVREKVKGGEQTASPSVTPSLEPSTLTLQPSPGTPPAPPPTEKIPRAPASGAYVPGQTSVERHNVVDDPYREPPL